MNTIVCRLLHRKYHYHCFPDEFSLLTEHNCTKCGREWIETINGLSVTLALVIISATVGWVVMELLLP